jgi:hypothetical protein
MSSCSRATADEFFGHSGLHVPQNQANPLGTREEASREAPQKSEMENDAGGEPEVVLRFPEETGVQTVCLNTPCNSFPKAIIKTSAYGPRARSVRKIG